MIIILLIVTFLLQSLIKTNHRTVYEHKWFPRILCARTDGGRDSGVTSFFLIEWKAIFSIAILKFNNGSRDNYHSHAFNALTWWLKGQVTEEEYYTLKNTEYLPSLVPKLTLRSKVHRVVSSGISYGLTFRGPWNNTWQEFTPTGVKTIMTHGRNVV